jgi:cell wall-associated NlpC family hydrolase
MPETIISPTGKVLRFCADLYTTISTDTSIKEVRIDMPTGRFIRVAEGQGIADVAKKWADADVPYVSNGRTKQGADCSGSTSSIYAEAGFAYPHHSTSGFPDLVGTDSHFIKGKHFFKKVDSPQVGDVGLWSNGKLGKNASGHMAIYDANVGKTPKGLVGNLWSASNPTSSRKYGSARIDFFDHKSGYGTVTWYRYWKAQ